MAPWIKVFATNPNNVLRIRDNLAEGANRPPLSSDLHKPRPLPNKEGKCEDVRKLLSGIHRTRMNIATHAHTYTKTQNGTKELALRRL